MAATSDGGASNPKFLCLESWRGICAILVALVHLSALGHFYYFPPVRNGGLGVTYFFVLSGFVMMHAYGRKIRVGSDFGPFILKRFGRLYPMHIFTLLILVALEFAKLAVMNLGHVSAGSAPFTGANSVPSLFGNFFLINGLGFFDTFTWNGPSWTISTEFWVYVLFFVVMVYPKRAQSIIILLVLAAGAALFMNSMGEHPLSTIRGEGAMTCIYCFFLGILAHWVWEKSRHVSIGAGWAEAGTLALVSLAFFGAVPRPEIINPFIFAATIIIFAREGSFISKILLKKPLVGVGTISYSLYMNHFILLSLLGGFLRVLQSRFHIDLIHHNPGMKREMISTGTLWHMDFLALIYILILVAVSRFTYTMIEVPCRNYFTRLASRLQTPGLHALPSVAR